MSNKFDPIQAFWDDLLSEEPDRIQAAFGSLEAEAQAAVLTHLQKMVSEDGWHPLQQASAQAALSALHKDTDAS